MQQPLVPLDESRRLASLRALSVLDTPAEERYDRITRLAQRLFGVSAVTIGLVDERREWIKSTAGFPHTQLARNVSFAAHAIGEGELFVVEDTVCDRRFYDHPLVIDDLRVRFYAGQPIHATDGSLAGSLNLYDARPRKFENGDRQALSDLAAIAERELREQGLSRSQLEVTARDTQRIDPLTRLWNRSAMFDIVRRELEQSRHDRVGVAFLIVDVDRMREVNENNGHAKGDWVLSEVARILRTSLRPTDVIARFAGEEFGALLSGVDGSNAFDAAERVRLAIAREMAIGDRPPVSVSIGAATSASAGAEPESLVRTAQAALWVAKKRGGNSVSVSSTDVPAGALGHSREITP
jgi:diguanylate cyclase (GGDEF)-like protein